MSDEESLFVHRASSRRRWRCLMADYTTKKGGTKEVAPGEEEKEVVAAEQPEHFLNEHSPPHWNLLKNSPSPSSLTL